MTEKGRSISIIVPVFNECQIIQVFAKELLDELANINIPFEVIFVDDGSSDGTVDLIKKLQIEYASIKLVAFTRNFGHQYALWAGLERATGSAVVMMDGDLQHPPSVIQRLIEHWLSGSLVVQTIRKDTNTPIFKKISSKLFYTIVNLFSDVKLSASAADFRLIDKVVVKTLMEFKEADLFLRGLIPWLSFPTTYVKFNSGVRVAGKSKYSILRMFKLAFTGITSLSTLPLKFTTVIGFAFSILSFYIGAKAIMTWIFSDRAVPGWTSVMVGVFFIGGLSMIFMGIIGEYLAKIFLEVKKRPRFIIREVSGFNDEE